MSVTESIDGIDFFYRIVHHYNKVYIKWNMKNLPDLFNGVAYSHEEKVEQYKEAIKELKKLNRKK